MGNYYPSSSSEEEEEEEEDEDGWGERRIMGIRRLRRIRRGGGWGRGEEEEDEEDEDEDEEEEEEAEGRERGGGGERRREGLVCGGVRELEYEGGRVGRETLFSLFSLFPNVEVVVIGGCGWFQREDSLLLRQV